MRGRGQGLAQIPISLAVSGGKIVSLFQFVLAKRDRGGEGGREGGRE